MEIFKFWIPKIPGSRISYFLSAIDRVRQNWRDAFWGKNPSYPKFSLHYYVHQTLSHGDFFFLHVDDFMPAQILDWGTTFPQIFYIEYYFYVRVVGFFLAELKRAQWYTETAHTHTTDQKSSIAPIKAPLSVPPPLASSCKQVVADNVEARPHRCKSRGQ